MAHATLRAGARRLSIVDVDPARAERLARSLSDRFRPAEAVAAVDVSDAMKTANGVINATPIGMHGHPGMPLAAEYLRPGLWVADIVYFPLETELLRAARLAGCRTLSGAGMTVFQAFEAFRLFTNVAPDAPRMLEHFFELSA